ITGRHLLERTPIRALTVFSEKRILLVNIPCKLVGNIEFSKAVWIKFGQGGKIMSENEKENMSRRRFLKNSGYVAGGVIGGGIIGSITGINFGPEETSDSSEETPKFSNALMYFSNKAHFAILSAACERIYPEDDNGPGAIKLDAPYFIDHQLAGAYGNNSNEYMQGPFKKGSPFQGYQTRLKRHEIFMQGILEIDSQSKKEYDDKFVEIEDEDKDDLLSKFESDDIDMKGVKSSDFFNLLREATLAGVYADPLYGGNAEKEGWKMKEYPGSQMSYTSEIEKENFVKMKPQSLTEHVNK